MESHVIPAVIILALNFHTPVTFDDSRLIKSDTSLSCKRGAACAANAILFCLFTQLTTNITVCVSSVPFRIFKEANKLACFF